MAEVRDKAIPERNILMNSIDLSKHDTAGRPVVSASYTFVGALLLVIALLPAAAAAKQLAAPDNFRVTGVTAYTVTVAWNPPRNNSGNFNYFLSGAYGVTPATLPKTATSHTFTRLHTSNQYWFYIYARDTGGNTSATASATTRTLADTTPPSSAPGVTVTEVGSNYLSISLTPAQDDCPFLSYQVSVNGQPYGEPSTSLSVTLRFLQPGTTYSLTARGRDEGHFWSPVSAPITATTRPPNPNDHTPPNTPPNLSVYSLDGATEMQIQWAQSTDDFDAQSNISYDTYVNGVLDDIRFGSGGPISAYGVSGQNTIQVIASDTAGNASPPATATINLP
jgi:hypothetical protein